MRVSREHGLVFYSKKCAIKTPQISFFDTIYDEKGDKVEDIKMRPTPEHSAANVGHIDLNVTVDKISETERLFWKGFNPLGERDRIMWNMHSAANVGHIDLNVRVDKISERFCSQCWSHRSQCDSGQDQ